MQIHQLVVGGSRAKDHFDYKFKTSCCSEITNLQNFVPGLHCNYFLCAMTCFAKMIFPTTHAVVSYSKHHGTAKAYCVIGLALSSSFTLVKGVHFYLNLGCCWGCNDLFRIAMVSCNMAKITILFTLIKQVILCLIVLPLYPILLSSLFPKLISFSCSFNSIKSACFSSA